jgi:hypothetical protein
MPPITQRRIVLAAVLGAVLCHPALGAQGDDPDWPCIQRKVPQLSLEQIWTGAELPPAAAGWSQDPVVSAWVDALSARRLPLAEAQQTIRDAAATLPLGERQPRMTMLVQGLFDRMDRERSQVIAGIARYAHRQRESAEALRKEAAAVDGLRGRTDTPPGQLAIRVDRLALQTRIFQERVQSLSYVCEVPTLIEQRLYALARTISDVLAPQK